MAENVFRYCKHCGGPNFTAFAKCRACRRPAPKKPRVVPHEQSPELQLGEAKHVKSVLVLKGENNGQ
jgi:hypothetical protein